MIQLHLFIHQSCTFLNFFIFIYYNYGSIKPLNYPQISHRAPNPWESRISNTKIFVFWCRVWMDYHRQFSISFPIASQAFRFFCSSVIPFILPFSIQQLELGEFLEACFWNSLAPFVRILGFGLQANSSSVNGLFRRLYMCSKSYLEGGRTVY